MILDSINICSSFHPHSVTSSGRRNIQLVVTAIFAALAAAMIVTAIALPMVQLMVPAIICAIIAIGIGADIPTQTTETIIVVPQRTPGRGQGSVRGVRTTPPPGFAGAPSAPPGETASSPFRPSGPSQVYSSANPTRGRNIIAYPVAYDQGDEARVGALFPPDPGLVLPKAST